MNQSKYLLFVGITIAAIIGVVGYVYWGQDNARNVNSSRPFRVAFNTWVGYSPLVIARENGFLAEQGLDVEFSILEGIGEKNSALIRKDIDAVGHTADSAVTSAASNVDGQIVFVFDRSLGADGILAKTSITSISDLKGKKVALEAWLHGLFLFTCTAR